MVAYYARYIKYDRKQAAGVIAVLVSIPFIQLGFSYYLSVMFVLFMGLLLWSLMSDIVSRGTAHFTLLVFVIFFVKVLSQSLSDAHFSSILATLRECLCFIALILISTKLKRIKMPKVLYGNVILFIMITTLALVLVQYFSFRGGEYIGWPFEFFVTNRETIESAEKALYFGTRFRPSGFHGEPSYAAWVVLSLLVALLVRQDLPKDQKYRGLILAVTIIIILESFAGFLSFLVIVVVWLPSSMNKGVFSILFSVLFVIFSGLLIYTLSSDINQRFFSVLQATDSSTKGRLLTPLYVLADAAKSGNVFGVDNYWVLIRNQPIHNALIGLLIEYGVLSLFLLSAVFSLARKNSLILVYLVLSFNFNGSFLIFDKVIIVAFIIASSEMRLINIVKAPSANKPFRFMTTH